MDNVLITLFYTAGICFVFGVGAFICDVILPRLVDTNKGPRPMATRLSPEELERRTANRVARISNTQRDN